MQPLKKLDLETVTLSEVSHTEKEKYCVISYICGIQKEKIQMNLFTETVREGRREKIVREFGMVMYTLLYLKWITNKDLLCWELCSMLRGSLDGKGVWGRMDTCMYG